MVWSYVRVEWRHRAGSLLLIAIVLSIAGGATVAGAAGARRTASALTRLRAEAVAADAIVQYPLGDQSPAEVSRIGEAIAQLPGVTSLAEVRVLFLVADDGDFSSTDLSYGNLSTGSVDGRFGRDMERGRLLRGERPDPSDPLAVSVSEGMAERLDLEPGSTLDVLSLAPEQLECVFTGCAIPRPEGPRLRLRVSGVERFVVEALGSGNPQQLLLTPAFVDRYGDDVASFGSLFAVRLSDGRAGIDGLTGELEELVAERGDDPEELFVSDTLGEAAGILDASRAVALGLGIFAAIAGAVGLSVLAQTLVRHLSASRTDGSVLRAIGCRSQQRMATAVAAVAPAIVAGAVGTLVLAALLSPLFPIGQARHVEPSPGLRVDGIALTLGALAVLMAGSTIAVLAHHLVHRPRRRDAVVSVPAVRSLPPVVGIGLRAGSPQAGGSTRQGLGGAGLAVTIVLAALVFGSSLERFVDSPARDGWPWDLEVSIGDDSDDAAALAEARSLAADPDVQGVLLARVQEMDLGPAGPSAVLGTVPVESDLGLTVIAGRAPVAVGEVALGRATADALGAGVGDEVDFPTDTDATVALRVVGLARFPGVDRDAPDQGAWMTNDQLRAVSPDENGFPTTFAELRAGADVDATVDRLGERYTFVDGEPRRSSDTANLEQLSGLPAALAALAAVLGAGALLHALLVGVRRRRHQLGVLAALGFTRRQLAATIWWQALSIAALGLLLGVPLGIGAGRTAWSWVADAIGARPDPLVPAWSLSAIPAVLAIAWVAAFVPGGMARRARPVTSPVEE